MCDETSALFETNSQLFFFSPSPRSPGVLFTQTQKSKRLEKARTFRARGEGEVGRGVEGSGGEGERVNNEPGGTGLSVCATERQCTANLCKPGAEKANTHSLTLRRATKWMRLLPEETEEASSLHFIMGLHSACAGDASQRV